MNSASFVRELGVGIVTSPHTQKIRDDLMHPLKPEAVGTWEGYTAATRHYRVPDHLRTLCPHCEKEDVLLKYLSSREVPLCRTAETNGVIAEYSIIGKARCSNCNQDSDIILHGYQQEQRLADSERWLEIWIHPKPIDATTKAPEGTPTRFAKDYREAVEILGASPNASAALARRGLERVLKEQFNVEKGSLSEKIDKAIVSKRLPADISDMLHTLREIGNHGAHVLDSSHAGEIIEVNKEEAILSMEILREVLDYAFARPARRAAKKAELAEKYKKLN